MTGSFMPYRKLVVLAVLLFAVFPLAAATEWNITEAHVLPEFSIGDDRDQHRASGVVIAEVRDKDGKPVTPERCEEYTVMYDYDSVNNTQMSHGDTPEGWFYNDLTLTPEDTELILYTWGECDGIPSDGTTKKTINLTESASPFSLGDRPERREGSLRVEFLNDVYDTFWEGETIDGEWDVSKLIPGDTAFVPDGNLTYMLYRPDLTVIQTGTVPVVGEQYERTIELPRSENEVPASGLYILNVMAYNESLTEDYDHIENPFGGAARPVWVEPTYIWGESSLHPSVEQCGMDEQVLCEKGATVELGYMEEHGDADEVRATVIGLGTGNVFEEVELERWNGTYWNASFSIPSDFDTLTYSSSLEIVFEAVRQFERDGVQEEDNDVDMEYIDIAPFGIFESTPPFVQLGNRINIGVVPVTPFTENPKDPELFSRMVVNITDSGGNAVHDDLIQEPEHLYDHDENLFKFPFDVHDISTGIYYAEVTLTDRFDVSSSVTSDFRVITANDTTEPVVLIGAGGEIGNDNITTEYDTPGTFYEPVILQNVGEDVEWVSVAFDGDLDGIADFTVDGDWDGGSQIRFSPEQQRVIHLRLEPEESRDYSGNAIFQVEGAYVDQYNITLPVEFTVDCIETFGPLCITATDLEQDVSSVGDHELTVDIENRVNQSETFTVAAQGEFTELLTQETTWTEDVDALGDVRVTMPYRVESYHDGSFLGDIVFTHTDGTVDMNASVEVDLIEGSIEAWTAQPELGEFVEGDTATVSLLVNNTGAQFIEDVDVYSEDLDFVETDTVSLDTFEVTELEYGVQVPGGIEEVATVMVEADIGAYDSIEYNIRTFPDHSRQITELQDWVEQQQREMEQIEPGQIDEELHNDINNGLRRMMSILQDAEDAWEAGNYELAIREFDDAEGYRASVENDLSFVDPGETDEENGLWIQRFVLPMLIILILFAVSGVILYLSIVPEEDQY